MARRGSKKIGRCSHKCATWHKKGGKRVRKHCMKVCMRKGSRRHRR